MNAYMITNKKEKHNYKAFFKQYKWLHFALIMMLIVALFLVVGIFSNWFNNWEGLKEFSGWASLIAGILTYFGSSFLGIVVFFNTWQRQKIEDESYVIMAEVNCKCFCENDKLRPYSETELNLLGNKYKTWGGSGAEKPCGYMGVRIRNLNEKLPMYINIVSVYYVNDNNELVSTKYDFKATEELGLPLDYKEINWCYIGIDNSLIRNGSLNRFVYVLRFTNIKGDDKYCCYFVNLFPNGINPLPIYLTAKEYEQSIKTNKHPFGKYKMFLEYMIKDYKAH